MRVPRPPVLVGDFRPESACVWHTAISAGPPSPANPAILWHVPLVSPSGGFGGAVDCVRQPLYSPLVQQELAVCVHQPKPVQVRNDPGAGKLGLRWAQARASLCVCRPRYALCDPGSGGAVGATGMRKTEKTGPG